MRRPPHELTELAVALEYDVVGAAYPAVAAAGQSRIRGNRPGALYGPAADELQVQGAYLRAVSIAEAYVDAVSADLFDRRIGARNHLMRTLADAAIESAEDTWGKRNAAFKRFHEVDIDSLQEYKDLGPAVDIRNAIAHGLGALTRRQRNDKVRRRIAAAGVALIDDRLVLKTTDLNDVCAKAVAFILKVDTLLPPPPSRLRAFRRTV